MAIEYNNVITTVVHYQMSTTNRSFLNMHYYLKDIGIVRNKFMLALYDPDLAPVDPFDSNLSMPYKAKILREVMCNYWYFIRECVRIPDSGGTVGGGTKYKLHRGNMALGFCMLFNINAMEELPRQQGKTAGAIVWYLYLFNFGTSNSTMAFLNKRLDDSKYNLQVLRDIRAALPEYLQMNKLYDRLGKEIKATNRVESIEHPSNKNKIITVPSARNKVSAANLLRGRTIPLIWCDEYAFIPYNDIIYTNMVPAFNTAANNARRNRTHYGILITTTPGTLTTDEGLEAYHLKESATPFSEKWYDLSYNELIERLNCNTNSDFVYIRFTYQQLGADEAWFKEICRRMRNDWQGIRREVLLEWAEASDNCPFRKDDLEIIRVLVKDPKTKVPVLGGKYEINLYDSADISHYPPIIGVDVSGGFNRDSSAITIIDSQTTKVIGDFNCNYISIIDLSRVIYELVTRYMPNAVVNVERNGGYGASVLAHLLSTSIKRNLFYEIKDAVCEESFTVGGRVQRTKKRVKSYGVNSDNHKRELVIEILRNRVENHKDKFISKKLFEEMVHMEQKKNGRIEHSVNTHDDQVFSYLWALYVWYEGKDLLDNWGIKKGTIHTDAELDETVMTIDEKYKPILDEVMAEVADDVQVQLDQLNRVKAVPYKVWLQQEIDKQREATNMLLQTPMGRQGYATTFNCDLDDMANSGFTTLPSSIFGDDIQQEDISSRFNLRQFINKK